jgi:glycerol-3-phosphate cytidylyltransferase
MLESIKYVDQIIPEDGWIQKRQDIKNNKVDIFVMGDDWSGKFDDLSDLCEVLYLSRTKGVSTTELKLIMDK